MVDNFIVLDDYASNLTREQHIRLQLLSELDVLCKKYGIAYSISDELLAGILKKEDLANYLHDISVVMTPENYFLFLKNSKALEKIENRGIENIYNNIYYPSDSTRYVATNTLSVSLLATPFKLNGLFISIRMMKPDMSFKQGKIAAKLLPVAKEIKSISKYINPAWRWMTYPFAKYAALQRIKSNKDCLNGEAKKFVLSIAGVKEKYKLDSGVLDNFLNYSIGDYKFKSIALSDVLEEKLIYSLKEIAYQPKDKKKYIESTEISYRDWLDATKGNGNTILYYHLLWEDLYLALIKRVEKSSKFSQKRYLRDFTFKFYQYKFNLYFSEKIEDIYQLAAGENYDELFPLIEDYILVFDYFMGFKKYLFLNQILTEALIKIFRHQGRDAHADEVEKIFKKKFPLKIGAFNATIALAEKSDIQIMDAGGENGFDLRRFNKNSFNYQILLVDNLFSSLVQKVEKTTKPSSKNYARDFIFEYHQYKFGLYFSAKMGEVYDLTAHHRYEELYLLLKDYLLAFKFLMSSKKPLFLNQILTESLIKLLKYKGEDSYASKIESAFKKEFALGVKSFEDRELSFLLSVPQFTVDAYQETAALPIRMNWFDIRRIDENSLDYQKILSDDLFLLLVKKIDGRSKIASKEHTRDFIFKYYQYKFGLYFSEKMDEVYNLTVQQRYDELFVLLEDYLLAFDTLLKWKRPLFFNQILTESLLKLLRYQGEDVYASKVESIFKKEFNFQVQIFKE